MRTTHTPTSAILLGFAVTLAVGAGVNSILSLSSSPATARAAAGVSVGGASWKDTTATAATACEVRTAGTSSPAVTDRLLSALIAVESGGDPRAIGDGGRAVGVLQIHACVVADVNEWLGEKRYSLADRLDPEKSVEMFHHYIARWCPDGTDEEKARSWNGGGPRGRFKESTRPYWAKVKAAMEEQR